jgi:hypothetical protein
MKFILFSIFFFFITISLFAQTITYVGTQMETKMMTATETRTTTAAIVAAHNELAFVQISDYLKDNLAYPVEMTRYAFDGNVTAAVIFSAEGKVAQVMIAKTDLPEAFQQELTKTLFSLKKLRFKGRAYMGNSIVYVPVHFSL